jgi:two-component sensor histidine kinase
MIMVYSRFKTKKKNNEALKEKNAIIQHSLDEKEVLLREIHHRVQNNLQFVSSMLNLQSRRVNDEYTLNVLKDCKLRIQSMAMIHQKLYQEDSLKGINILNYTQNLIESLMHSYQIDSSEVDVELDIEQLYLDINSPIPIGLILNELITNCFKYAFTEKIRARLVVTLKETEGGLHLTVEDNGPGLPSNFEVDGSDSFGLKLVKSLAAKLKAEIQMKSEHGAEVSVLIKEYEKVSNGI